MFSYTLEFDLDVRGDDADKLLLGVLRTWPGLYHDLSGVTGTLLLSSALSLGGDFDYQWRVDIEATSVLARLDEAEKSGDRRWQEAHAGYLRHRTRSRASVCQLVSGDEYYARPGEGPVHLALLGSAEHDDLRSAATARSVQTVRAVLGSAAAPEMTWVRLTYLEGLDEFIAFGLDSHVGRVFAELSEVDGALHRGV